MEKRWAIVLFVLVLVIIFCALYYFLIGFESNEATEEDQNDKNEFNNEAILNEISIYDNWYLSAVNEDGSWVLYDPTSEETMNFNQTWVFEDKLNNGSLLYTNPKNEDKLIIY